MNLVEWNLKSQVWFRQTGHKIQLLLYYIHLKSQNSVAQYKLFLVGTNINLSCIYIELHHEKLQKLSFILLQFDWFL